MDTRSSSKASKARTADLNYHGSRPPRSQPPVDGSDQVRAKKKRSANQVKSRPANPAAIQAILDSFDTLTPPPAIRAHDHPSGRASPSSSRRPRRYSSNESLSLAPSPAPSAGFGMEYGAGVSYANDTDSDDAAAPPIIRTSRSPSRRSTHQAPSPSRPLAISNGYLRPASIISRTSSQSSLRRDRDSDATKKHSAESWIKQAPEAIDQASVKSERFKMSQRSLRRMTSEEALRLDRTETEDSMAVQDLDTLAGAEMIFAKPAPAPAPKGRLYLSDDATVPEALDEKDPEYSTIRDSGIDAALQPQNVARAADHTESGSTTPKRLSPQKNPIVDSIPTRTSSLRQANNSSASGKKRNKKSTKPSEAKSETESPLARRARSIPESSWADLGEDDETVKRIRQLREQRKSRIEESQEASLEAGAQHSGPKSLFVATSAGANAHQDKRGSRIRPSANRNLTDTPVKSHNLLGNESHNVQTPGLIGASFRASKTPSISPERQRQPRPQSPSRQNDIKTQVERPGTTTPPLTLDYSYAQAVDALQSAEFALDKQSSRRASAGSVTLDALDLTKPKARNASNAADGRRQPPDSARQRAEGKLAPLHPDLPLDFERKRSRRKSMSDARRTRNQGDELDTPRRDSIEDAIVRYLFAQRLNHKVKHPVTGRVISFSEVGDPRGAAVFVCVGMGLTRYVTAFYDELATTLHLRLITVDRPGVGASEQYPPGDRSGPLNWPDDILAICQHLDITKFSLLAHSAGAIYALATALTLPHMIRGKVHLLAPWIPPSQLEAIKYPTTTSPPAGALPRSQRLLRVLPTSFLKAANSSFMTATSASLKPANKRQLDAARAKQQREQSMSPSRTPDRPSTGTRPGNPRRESMMEMDQFMPTINPMKGFPVSTREDDGEERRGSLGMSATATPTDPSFTFASAGLNAAEHAERERQIEYTQRLTERTWELATRDSNPATDLLVCLERHREIGFCYTDVSREVVITHGSDDKRVPLGNIKWLSEQMNARALAGIISKLDDRSVPPTRDTFTEDVYSRGGCDVRVLEGEGHGLMASAPIMSDVLTELAGYWIGQDKGRFPLSV
ncbi:alpha/beta-hydrolase [Hortaea werneckii]|nr:alpha/beta-hydrolase [Hortaea werneckii]KAI7357583.1 alpha/beta-hydrolase [Hortaea werneckii]